MDPGVVPKPITRRWTVAAFVLSGVFTSALTVGGGYFGVVLQSQRTERQADYDQFRQLTAKTDKAVASFMEVYLTTASVGPDGRRRTPLPLTDPALAARAKVVATDLQEQDEALEQISLRFDKPEADLAARYRDELGTVFTEIDRLHPAEGGRALVQAIAKARDTRIDIMTLLQRRAHRLIP